MEEITKWKEKLEEDDEFLKFDRIENPLHENPDICGLMKLYDMCGKMSIDARYEIIYVSPVDGYKVDLSYEHLLYLNRCGFFFDTEWNCFAAFT